MNNVKRILGLILVLTMLGAVAVSFAGCGDTDTSDAEFHVENDEGNNVDPDSMKGKPVVINLWASWCGPCCSELPHFEEAYREYGDRVEFMMINLTDGTRETLSGAKEFIEDNGYTFPVYFDTDQSAANAYRITSIPLTVFKDAEGKEYKKYIGAMTKETLYGFIEELLEVNE